ncbi:MAG: tetratricopeptide repeat protein [Gammaproteobacteria bacterium]|nr:tetratricopeptide repeat protein [Gammaproteobacteria bacterium]
MAEHYLIKTGLCRYLLFFSLCLNMIPNVIAEDGNAVSYQKLNERLIKVEQLSQSARQATEQRRYVEALADLKSALELLNEHLENEPQVKIATLNCQLGAVYIEQGHWPEADESLLVCLETADRLHQDELAAEALVKLGQNAFKQGLFESATSHLQKAVVLTTAINDLPKLAFARLWLGAIAALNKNFKQAERELLDAVAIAQKAEDPSTEGRARNILGENARLNGQYETAIKHYQQALGIYESIDNRFGMTMVIHNLGHVMTMMGDTQTALQHYERSLKMAVEINAIPAALEILAALAEIAADAGETERALDLLGLVYAHSAAPKEALHMFADPTLALLQKEFPAERIESGLARGRALKFEKVVADILSKKH